MEKSNLTSWEDAVRWLRNQPESQQLVLDSYYDDPLLAAAQRYHSSPEWRAIRGLLPAPASGPVLDVGAGRGIASYALARDGYDVTALEPDASDLVGAGAIRGLAAEARLNIDVCGDFSERLPFADSTFSVVFARAVLHHTADLKDACKEFFRVLKPGGRLIAVREHVISHEADLEAFFRIHPLHHRYGGEKAYRLGSYLQAIQSAGFQVRTVLAPLESEINTAPHTLDSMRTEVAIRLSGRNAALSGLLDRILRIPGCWYIVLSFLRMIDRRPGRLYSFIAERP